MSLIEAAERSRGAKRPKLRTLSPIAADLVERRKELGLSQAEVARRMNRCATEVSGWEYGRNDPSLRNLEIWCAALGLRLSAEGV